MRKVCVCALSRARRFVTPWTAPARLLCPWGSPGKNTGVGCHLLLQGLFLGSNLRLLCLLHWQADPLPLNHRIRYKHTGHFNSFFLALWGLSSPQQGLNWLLAPGPPGNAHADNFIPTCGDSFWQKIQEIPHSCNTPHPPPREQDTE